jgi:hypothetical protein
MRCSGSCSSGIDPTDLALAADRARVRWTISDPRKHDCRRSPAVVEAFAPLNRREMQLLRITSKPEKRPGSNRPSLSARRGGRPCEPCALHGGQRARPCARRGGPGDGGYATSACTCRGYDGRNASSDDGGRGDDAQSRDGRWRDASEPLAPGRQRLEPGRQRAPAEQSGRWRCRRARSAPGQAERNGFSW